MEMIYIILYEEETKGLEGPEKVSTRWPARCHVTHHVHVAELKETAQVPPPPTYFNTKEEYEEYVEWVLRRLYKENIPIIIKKYEFYTKKTNFIGFIIEL